MRPPLSYPLVLSLMDSQPYPVLTGSTTRDSLSQYPDLCPDGQDGHGTSNRPSPTLSGFSVKREATQTGIQPREVLDPKTKRLKTADQRAFRKLACPFFKRNKHSRNASKSCAGPGWESVHRIKEHLTRCHVLKNQCLRCRQGFPSSADLAEHLRAAVPCEVRNTDFPDCVTEEQVARIRFRGKEFSNVSEEEKWKLMYRVLFENDSRIPSPFSETPCSRCASKGDTKLLEEFRRFQLERLPALMHREFVGYWDTAIEEHRTMILIGRVISRLSTDFMNSRANESSTRAESSLNGEEMEILPAEWTPSLDLSVYKLPPAQDWFCDTYDISGASATAEEVNWNFDEKGFLESAGRKEWDA
ncbi:hypothetical protein F5Y15DRAFT_354428 [Xylariaceae sp. FL0016]|nr:hypothetical protein F5Y15DRAFT_354428 [Xylariaceae sp. FL0016]